MRSIVQYINRTVMTTVIIVILSCSGCRKLVEVPAPANSLSSANIYTEDASAISVLTGIYVSISNIGMGSGFSGTSLTLFPGLNADELTLYSGAFNNKSYLLAYRNALSNQQAGDDYWSDIYPLVYRANAAIAGINASSTLTPAVKQQLLGEATFLRAFFYFYLVNLYGDVPLALTTDYKANAVLPRSPKAAVYAQIIQDLKIAQGKLSANFPDVTLLQNSPERVRPSKWAATALLARAYFYTGDWKNAEIQAGSLINNTALFNLSSLNNAFLKASSGNNEAIWQLQPVILGQNTEEAWLFIIPTTGPSGNYPVYLSNRLFNSFEAGDNRKTDWVNSTTAGGITYNYAYKYKSATLNDPVNEYEMVFRLGEQYLIRAEAESESGDQTAAIGDLNTIRNRAGLPNYAGNTSQATVLAAIMHERQVELFTEWGHRWFDLKRTGTIDQVMGAPGNACQAKGGIWSSYKQLYPIPLTDLKADQKLVQNPGY